MSVACSLWNSSNCTLITRGAVFPRRAPGLTATHPVFFLPSTRPPLSHSFVIVAAVYFDSASLSIPSRVLLLSLSRCFSISILVDSPCSLSHYVLLRAPILEFAHKYYTPNATRPHNHNNNNHNNTRPQTRTQKSIWLSHTLPRWVASQTS